MKRVSLKTAKGNIANFFVLSVAGDKNGMVGLGIGNQEMVSVLLPPKPIGML